MSRTWPPQGARGRFRSPTRYEKVIRWISTSIWAKIIGICLLIIAILMFLGVLQDIFVTAGIRSRARKRYLTGM